MSEEIDYRIQRLLETLDERFKEAERRLASRDLEFEDEVLNAINRLTKRFDNHEERLSKLEDTSAWNLLAEVAGKMGINPEQLMKKAITEYVKKQRKD